MTKLTPNLLVTIANDALDYYNLSEPLVRKGVYIRVNSRWCHESYYAVIEWRICDYGPGTEGTSELLHSVCLDLDHLRGTERRFKEALQVVRGLLILLI